MNIVTKKVKDIKPYKNNPRVINDFAVEKVANSIKEFGIKQPLVIDKDNIIIVGHTRLKACKQLGIKEVPCLIADDLTKEQIDAYRLADNKVAEFTDWDMGKLDSELLDITLDMEQFGFDLDLDDEEEGGGNTDEDDVPEPPIVPKSKLGEIYQLGKHRLMCGDSTSEKDVNLLMNGKKAELTVTDPPYLMDFDGSVNKDGSKSSVNSLKGKIKNDKLNKEESKEFLDKVLYNIKRVTIGSWYIFFYRLKIDLMFSRLSKAEMRYRALIIWDKPGGTLSNSDYKSRYEPIFFGWEKEHNFYGGNDKWDICTFNKTTKNDLHPTMKPVEVIKYLIENSSIEKDIVLDLFGGSGTTLIASEQTGRTCYMMELDPIYIDVIIKRWEDYTGNKAELIREV